MADPTAELRERVATETDLVLFDEAVKCLGTGAHRAAFIMTWLATAESLRARYSKMAFRDAEMGQLVGEIEQAEKQGNSADKLILDKAWKFGLITEAEYKKLEHLRDMRNTYAHPTGSAPTSEEVVAALVVAVDAVLSKPALMRHGYARAVLGNLFDDQHFLADSPGPIEEYARSVATNLHPDVLPFLLEGLLRRLEPIMTDPDLRLIKRRATAFAIELLRTLKPDLSQEHWNVMLLIQTFPAAAPAVLGRPELWPLLSDQARHSIVSRLLEPIQQSSTASSGILSLYMRQPRAPDRNLDMPAPRQSALRQVRALSLAGVLTPNEQRMFNLAVARAPYATLHAAGIPLRDYVAGVIENLQRYTWDPQNAAAEALRRAGPEETSDLEPDVQEQLGRNVLQAAEGTAHSAIGLIAQIERGDAIWPRSFIEGLLTECLVNDDGQFRLKKSQLGRVARIALKHPDSDQIMAAAVARVENSRPKFGSDALEDYDEAVRVLEELRTTPDTEANGRLAALATAITESKAKAALAEA